MPAAPPLPPSMGGAAAPQQTPNFMQLAGMGAGAAMQSQPTAGMSQISDSAVRMGAEIDQALKMLAQAIPTLAPWVEKTCLELRYQIGTSLQSGNVPTDPTSQDNARFPDGGARL